MNLEEKSTMTSRASLQAEHLYYVRCSICNTILAVGIPLKRMLDTVTVKCGHCGNLSFLTASLPLQGHVSLTFQMQSFGGREYKKGSSSSSSSSTSSDQPSPTLPLVVKPPEKKQRLPSAYNRFMRDEIQRIKSANPEIPHREAFSAAAKNWAKYIPNSPTSITSGGNNINGLGFGQEIVKSLGEKAKNNRRTCAGGYIRRRFSHFVFVVYFLLQVMLQKMMP